MQRGAALIIVLVLLAILTMLVVAGAGTSTAELVMAGNEQYRELAADAASAAIEQAIAQLGPASPSTSTITASNYAATSRYVGDESNLPESSAEKFLGHHYVIESTGTAPRGAIESQTQGVLIVVPTAGVGTFNLMGSGLTGGRGP